jgi:hypothetical protein
MSKMASYEPFGYLQPKLIMGKRRAESQIDNLTLDH